MASLIQAITRWRVLSSLRGLVDLVALDHETAGTDDLEDDDLAGAELVGLGGNALDLVVARADADGALPRHDEDRLLAVGGGGCRLAVGLACVHCSGLARVGLRGVGLLRGSDGRLRTRDRELLDVGPLDRDILLAARRLHGHQDRLGVHEHTLDRALDGLRSARGLSIGTRRIDQAHLVADIDGDDGSIGDGHIGGPEHGGHREHRERERPDGRPAAHGEERIRHVGHG